jgi:hypothetical protein
MILKFKNILKNNYGKTNKKFMHFEKCLTIFDTNEIKRLKNKKLFNM